jgi:hypothetical protein
VSGTLQHAYKELLALYKSVAAHACLNTERRIVRSMGRGKRIRKEEDRKKTERRKTARKIK